MKKVAIYGGAFDPPHYGHNFGIWALLYSSLFDEIWVIPSSDRIDKPNATNSKHRLKMLSLLLENTFSKNVVLKDIQITDSKCPKTSYQLIKYLESKNKDIEFSLAIGAELISELSTWKDYNELVEEVNFVIIPRLGIIPNVGDFKKVSTISSPRELDFNISSSVIRSLIENNIDLSGIMPKEMLSYIVSNKLYVLR